MNALCSMSTSFIAFPAAFFGLLFVSLVINLFLLIVCKDQKKRLDR